MKKTSLATLLLMGGGVMALPPTHAQTENPGGAQEQKQQPVGPYIIIYREPAIASYKGGINGIPMPARDQRGALTVSGPRAATKSAYAQHLRSMQRQHETVLSQTIGRSPLVKQRMYHAVNGAVMELTDAEAQRIQQMPDVMLVESYREYELDTDRGPKLIGATELWESAPASRDRITAPRDGARGEGIVVGILDTGINAGSPSFSSVARDGYRHINPKGSGVYLGTCAPGGVDEGRCNDKLIGGYDFVCGEPVNACESTVVRDEPGFLDNSGHGSHVASTVAGNPRTVELSGETFDISGVAPRANIIAYDVCYESETGGCPNTATAAAVDQAVQDGVDVINFSIGGGASPWTSAPSLAFLGAVDAGVTVVASAGNSGPDPATVGHQEPWTITTAAAKHGRGPFAVTLQVTGPGTPPEALRNITLAQGVNGVPHTAAIPGNTPLRISPTFSSGADGCEPYAAQTFSDGIAVIRRGGCSFTTKVNHADSAGARAVVIANNIKDDDLTPSVPDTLIPTFALSLKAGDALFEFANGRAATAGVTYPAVSTSNVVDSLAGFSSRGPAFYDLIKPDITAPGFAILAAEAGPEIEGLEELVGLKNGTSMASPHVAGVAALLSQLHPDWTPSEIKSAIMMTSTPLVLLEDEETPADPFAMGAGRVQAVQANDAWLLMDESAADYLDANPADGGDISQLNTPSMANDECSRECSFTRTFRNPLNRDIQWKARVEGVPGSVSPSSFIVKRGAEVSVTVTIDARDIDSVDAWSHGQLVLEPQLRGKALNNTHRLPISVFVPPPAIALLPEAGVDMSLAAGQRGKANLGILNVGGGVLQWQNQVDGVVSLPVYVGTNDEVTSGNRSTFFTDRNTGTFASDDFTVVGPVQLNHLSVTGFVVSGKEVGTITDRITWSIYPDAGGVPAGDPITSPDAAVWSYTTTATGPGMRVIDDSRLEFNPLQAGQTVNLPAGTYWLVAYMDTLFADRWAWFYSNQVSGHPAQSVTSPSASNRWRAVGNFPGMTFEVAGTTQCGASWLGAMTPASGSIVAGEQSAASIDVNSADLAAGHYLGQVCVSSNDPTLPVTALPVRLQVE
ncbi:S8 family serine peptidase [Pseudoxanthomonas dokdonensis]|uniref:Protease domain-containing protein n=1 Tax=Pseudoxanthomonas dokdonensis TaxID=344882 RepID=A0A0R0CHN8_9GAMM|nr:S8 family serine peptidase [Pseudoxanthomonas dokdonensis]KRG68976.1 hypothetical protein ABB29_11060 [Pseudoxanthomonas dokdonensis]